MLNAGIIRNCCIAALWLYLKDYRAYREDSLPQETLPTMAPWSGRPRVTTASNDRYIVLQHLRNRRLTAVATKDSMVFIHTLSEISWDKTFNLFMCTNRTSGKFSPNVIEWQGGIGAAVICTSDVLIGTWICFLMNVGSTLAMPTDTRVYCRREECFADA